MRRHWRVLWTAGALVLGLMGCSEEGIRENLREEGRPATYIDGYIDGCKTGLFRSGDKRYGNVKDAARYRVELPYRQGWDRGVEECAKGQGRLQEYMDEVGY